MNTSDIQVEGLTFRYPDGQLALRNISFQIAPHEKVALLGPNGAGKSTLLLHLNGILRGEAGKICMADLPLTEANLGKIRAKVGLVFQNPDDQLFSLTVHQDVAFGPTYMGCSESQIQERVSQALAAVGMGAYEKRVSYHLSVGEKKRIALATVLSMDAAILILDEPSAGLDPRARKNLIHLLQTLPQTMLISTHDIQLAKDLCPRTLILDDGQLVADGSTTDLLNNADFLRAHGF